MKKYTVHYTYRQEDSIGVHLRGSVQVEASTYKEAIEVFSRESRAWYDEGMEHIHLQRVREVSNGEESQAQLQAT